MIIGCSMKPGYCLTNGVARDHCDGACASAKSIASRTAEVILSSAERRNEGSARPGTPSPAGAPITFLALGLMKASRLRRRLVLRLVGPARRPFRTALWKSRHMLAVMVPSLCSTRKSDFDISRAVQLVG